MNLVVPYVRVPSNQIRVGIQEEKDFQVLETVSSFEGILLNY